MLLNFLLIQLMQTRFAEEMAIVHKEIYNKYASKNATIKRVNKTLLTDAKRVFLNQLAKLGDK